MCLVTFVMLQAFAVSPSVLGAVALDRIMKSWDRGGGQAGLTERLGFLEDAL